MECYKRQRPAASYQPAADTVVLEITSVGDHFAALDVDVEVERPVSGRLNLDVVFSRWQVQRTLRIVVLLDDARVDSVNRDTRAYLDAALPMMVRSRRAEADRSATARARPP
jgi:hypothetical protein